MRKLCLFLLLALLLTACVKSSPAAVTTEPEQEVTGVLSETTALLETGSPDIGIPWNDPSSIGGSTWQEAYLSVIKCDRKQLLLDPDNSRFPGDPYIYLGIGLLDRLLIPLPEQSDDLCVFHTEPLLSFLFLTLVVRILYEKVTPIITFFVKKKRASFPTLGSWLCVHRLVL